MVCSLDPLLRILFSSAALRSRTGTRIDPRAATRCQSFRMLCSVTPKLGHPPSLGDSSETTKTVVGSIRPDWATCQARVSRRSRRPKPHRRLVRRAIADLTEPRTGSAGGGQLPECGKLLRPYLPPTFPHSSLENAARFPQLPTYDGDGRRVPARFLRWLDRARPRCLPVSRPVFRRDLYRDHEEGSGPRKKLLRPPIPPSPSR